MSARKGRSSNTHTIWWRLTLTRQIIVHTLESRSHPTLNRSTASSQLLGNPRKHSISFNGTCTTVLLKTENRRSSHWLDIHWSMLLRVGSHAIRRILTLLKLSRGRPQGSKATSLEKEPASLPYWPTWTYNHYNKGVKLRDCPCCANSIITKCKSRSQTTSLNKISPPWRHGASMKDVIISSLQGEIPTSTVFTPGPSSSGTSYHSQQ